jgi:hypothetical protein
MMYMGTVGLLAMANSRGLINLEFDGDHSCVLEISEPFCRNRTP